MQRHTIARGGRGIQNITIGYHSMLLSEQEEREISLRHQKTFSSGGGKVDDERKKKE